MAGIEPEVQSGTEAARPARPMRYSPVRCAMARTRWSPQERINPGPRADQ